MTPLAVLIVWSLELVLVAALAATPRGARLGFGLALVGLGLPAFADLPPLPLTVMALGFLWCAVRAADFAFEPAPTGFGQRLLHLLVVVDSRLVSRSAPRFDAPALRRGLVAGLLAWGAIELMLAVATAGPLVHYGVRWSAGMVLTLTVFEALVASIGLIASASGWRTPSLHDRPHLARTVGEFWSRRWNRIFSAVLAVRAFAPLARRGPFLALSAAFTLSAVVHAYLIGFAGGALAAAAWAAFFLLQPLAIAAERRLGVRRWDAWAGHAWTIRVLGLLSPLMVEPALRVLGM